MLKQNMENSTDPEKIPDKVFDVVGDNLLRLENLLKECSEAESSIHLTDQDFLNYDYGCIQSSDGTNRSEDETINNSMEIKDIAEIFSSLETMPKGFQKLSKNQLKKIKASSSAKSHSIDSSIPTSSHQVIKETSAKMLQSYLLNKEHYKRYAENLRETRNHLIKYSKSLDNLKKFVGDFERLLPQNQPHLIDCFDQETEKIIENTKQQMDAYNFIQEAKGSFTHEQQSIKSADGADHDQIRKIICDVLREI